MPNVKIPSGVISPSWTLQQDVNGNLGIYKNGTEVGYFDSAGGITWLAQETTNPTSTFSIFRASGGGGYFLINLPDPANDHFAVAFAGTNALTLNPNGLSVVGNVGTGAGGGTTFGVPLSIQVDNRTGVTAVDASPITLYTVTASGELFRLSARAYSTAGSSATYVVKWTEGGHVNSLTLSVTALNTIVDAGFLIQPDSGTNITAQITAISSTTLNVATLVERIS